MNEPGFIEYSNYFSTSYMPILIDNSSNLTYYFGEIILPQAFCILIN